MIVLFSWFHGKISREQAENLLQPREDGLFLVRESTNYPGDYTLCVSYQGDIQHYRVIYKDNKLTIDEEEFFSTLAELVEVSTILLLSIYWRLRLILPNVLYWFFFPTTFSITKKMQMDCVLVLRGVLLSREKLIFVLIERTLKKQVGSFKKKISK